MQTTIHISDDLVPPSGVSKFHLNGEDAAVYCPKCGAYQGTKIGLQTHETAQVCVGGCEPIDEQGKSLVSLGWGTKFPIRYSTLHIKKGENIVDQLKRMGYSEISSGEVPGLETEKDERRTPKNIHRRDGRDTLISSKGEFEDFINKHHPIYLEIEHSVDGKAAMTYLKYQEPPLRRKIALVVSNLLRL